MYQSVHLEWYIRSYQAAARVQLEEGLSRFRDLGDRRGIAWVVNNLGNVAFGEGDYDTARARHEESLRIRRELGDRQGIALSRALGGRPHRFGDAQLGMIVPGCGESSDDGD